jgi:hypothetical protein
LFPVSKIGQGSFTRKARALVRNRSSIGHGALHCAGVELKTEETQVAALQKVALSADRKAVLLSMEAEITQQARAPGEALMAAGMVDCIRAYSV